MSSKRRILVTSALPYANNSLHIGHMVEYAQTDIWVRFQRMSGAECYYTCASDAHGTPTMLRAAQMNTSPEALLDLVYDEHRRDFARYRISVDNYRTTHSPENEEMTKILYGRLVDRGVIARRAVKQAYDEERGMFLPDRYVKGTCPVCDTPDQYGDSCENCGATYSPLEMKNAVSILSETPPSIRESEHLFLQLNVFESELRAWVRKALDSGMAKKLEDWFSSGLQDWDISREAPYFGFAIPNEHDKYFYVWFDALIGYMSSFLHFCRQHDIDFDDFWGPNSEAEVYHFIGKDIVYFHSLYWPAMLAGSGYRLPSGVVTHGFLTVDGQKMSKRRGTFILASKFAEHVDPDYLRYYFATKLGPVPEDIDLSLPDFIAKVNADLVGKFVNIGSRCAGFIHRLNHGKLGDTIVNEKLFQAFAAAGDEIAVAYEQREYAQAMRRIMALADEANQYIDDQKPWIAAKTPDGHATAIAVCTLGLNLFRQLSVYLKPVVPEVAQRIEKFLGCEELSWQDSKSPLLDQEIREFGSLLERIDDKQVARIIERDESGTEEKDQDLDTTIDLALFSKIEMRVAEVIGAEFVEGADKLLRLKLNTGDEERTVLSGIRSAYSPEQLIGRRVILLANLKARKMRFGISEGMVLAASNDEGGIFLLSADEGAKAGMKVS